MTILIGTVFVFGVIYVDMDIYLIVIFKSNIFILSILKIATALDIKLTMKCQRACIFGTKTDTTSAIRVHLLGLFGRQMTNWQTHAAFAIKQCATGVTRWRKFEQDIDRFSDAIYFINEFLAFSQAFSWCDFLSNIFNLILRLNILFH